MITTITSKQHMLALIGGAGVTLAGSAGGPPPCPADINTDMVVDAADLGILLGEYGSTGMGLAADLDSDDDVDQSDLGFYGPRFGLSDGCVNPFPVGSLTHSAARVDNASVQAGDDMITPDFAGGVSHFTFDINVDLSGGSVWTTSSIHMLLEPTAPFDIFQYASPFGVDMTAWSTSFIAPAVIYDTAFQAPQDMGEGDVGTTQSAVVQSADEFAVDCWFSIYPVPMTPSDGLIARLSIVRTGPGGEPIIVPAGACPSATRIGSVIVNTTHAFTDGQLHTASYEIIENPLVGDINGDLVVDTADLGALIAEFGNDAPYQDLNNDGVVDTADLGALIAEFGQSCP